ncbi:MAG: pilus assembly PilX N-terminal domain-containing protein [Microgenomates group bacterium]
MTMHFQKRRGQVLLIAIMLLATVVTVVMTIAFNSTTETQVAKLEEDSQKALAAAEAGIDSVIKQSVGTNIPLSTLGDFSTQGISGNAQVLSVNKNTFISPLLQKDEQYTFYLSDYPTFANPWSGNLGIYFLSEAGQCPSIEVLVVTNMNTQARYAFNTCAATINGAETASIMSTQIDDITFQRKILTPLSITNGTVAFVKVYGGRTKLGFKDEGGINNLPTQGKTVDSEARTQSGVVKKVQLFQSYPQIPSSFMMTSF